MDAAYVPQTLANLRRSLATSRSDLAAARLKVTHETNMVHDLYKQIYITSIRLLEQTIHGAVSRASKAKAEYLAIVAEGMAKKLGVQHQQLLMQIYSSEMQAELRECSAEMSREKISLRRKIESAEEKLEQYRAGRGMESMADEYAEILRETARARGDIAKLDAQRRL